MIRIIFFLSVTFIYLLNIHAQVRIHKHITTEDGLVDNKILSMIQDSKGYLWFGTYSGVSKWDGNNFENMTTNDGLTSPAILDIVEMPDSTLLFSTYGKGFVTYKNGIIDTFNTTDGLSSNMIYRFQDGKDYALLFSDKLQKFQSGKIIDYPIQPEILEGSLSNMELEENGNKYLSSRTGGFYVKEGKFEKLFTTKDGLFSNKISVMMKDFNDNILIGTYEGINKYKDGKITTLDYKNKSIKGFINNIMVANDSTIYYSCEFGLVVEKGKSIEILTTKNGLLENEVQLTLEDNKGNIFIGYSNAGISIYKPNRFTNYVSYTDDDKFIPNSIVQDNNSNLIIGTNNGLTNLSNKRIVEYNQLTNNTVLSLTVDKSNNLFIGTKRGFNILSDNVLEKYLLGNKSNNGINDIALSYDGDVLLAVRRQGIVAFTPDEQSNKKFITSFLNSSNPPEQEKVKGGTLSYITLKNGLQNTFILDLLNAKDSTLVIGYQGRGVSFYKDGVFKHINKEDGLTDGVVTTIFEDANGDFWFGTRTGGISIYQNGIFDTINVSNGLSSNDIRGIVKVNDKVYVSTANGLNVIVKYSDGYFVRKLYEVDGLASNSCSRNAFLLDKDNNIWIGTSKGISKFDPSSDNIISTPPKINIIGIELFNEKYPLDNIIKTQELNYDQNYIKFIYTGINLTAPNKVIFKYKLNGVDKDWIESNVTYANYTNLDDGDYTFEVKARNEWGFWSKPTSLPFTINPAWWETWWFYTLTIFSIGSLIAFIVSYRYRQLLAVEKIRNKISTDLHDSIGSGLSEITILSELLNAQPNAKVDDFKNGLENISVTARSLVGNMSDIVWLVNPSKDSLRDLLLRLHDSYQEVLGQANISFEIKNIEKLENMKLSMTFRQHLFLLFKEAINNALKYSKCSQLILDIDQSGKDLYLSLYDNGIGFDLSNHKAGNGLINMQNRAKQINGNLKITSRVNEGTTLKFSGKI